MKKSVLFLVLIPFLGVAQVKNTSKKPKTKTTVPKIKIPTVPSASTTTVIPGLPDISAGLKEALNNGIAKQVSKLTLLDGFYKNETVKIPMPEEMSLVEGTLRKFGMNNIVEDGVKSLNRAAEDAVKEATPVFLNAIKSMNITDAKSILMGSQNAATTYLQTATTKELYAKFSPIVQQSIGKVGADVAWGALISKYNNLPLVSKVNPDINDYVTTKALEGVFKMIAVEELNIRTDLKSRTSPLLQNVFGILTNK